MGEDWFVCSPGKEFVGPQAIHGGTLASNLRRNSEFTCHNFFPPFANSILRGQLRISSVCRSYHISTGLATRGRSYQTNFYHWMTFRSAVQLQIGGAKGPCRWHQKKDLNREKAIGIDLRLSQPPSCFVLSMITIVLVVLFTVPLKHHWCIICAVPCVLHYSKNSPVPLASGSGPSRMETLPKVLYRADVTSRWGIEASSMVGTIGCTAKNGIYHLNFKGFKIVYDTWRYLVLMVF